MNWIDRYSHAFRILFILAKAAGDAVKVQKCGNQYVRLQRDLEMLFQEWEELVESSAV